MKQLIAIVSLTLASAAFAGELPENLEVGLLEYPAVGNVQLDEGTLDLWVISNFDTDVKIPGPGTPDRRQATLFKFVFPEEQWNYSLYFIPWANGYAFVGYNKPGQPYIWIGPPHWKTGEEHHVTLVWSGRKRSAFIDGNCTWMGGKGKSTARDVDAGGPIFGDITKATLQIGGGYSIITVDEIQIRNIALTPEQIAAAKDAPLTADVNTLLLDHCDGTAAEVAGQKGALTGKYQLVDGKFGKAIQLWKEKGR